MPESKKEKTEKARKASRKRIKYTGRASVRQISEADFAQAGITDQGDVEFSQGNQWLELVSPEAAAFLIGLGGEFVRADEEDVEDAEEGAAEAAAVGAIFDDSKQ